MISGYLPIELHNSKAAGRHSVQILFIFPYKWGENQEKNQENSEPRRRTQW